VFKNNLRAKSALKPRLGLVAKAAKSH